MFSAVQWLLVVAFEEMFNMTAKRVYMASALLISTSLFAGCDAFSLLSASTPGVYKGRPDVHDAEAAEQRRKQLRQRVWATQGEGSKSRAL